MGSLTELFLNMIHKKDAIMVIIKLNIDVLTTFGVNKCLNITFIFTYYIGQISLKNN